MRTHTFKSLVVYIILLIINVFFSMAGDFIRYFLYFRY